MTLCPHHKRDLSWAACSADFTGCQVVTARGLTSNRRAPVLIPDDIAALAVSRQRKIQLAWRRLGLCITCGRPRDSNSSTYCINHAVIQREIQRKRRSAGSKIRYYNAASYRSEFVLAEKLQGLKLKEMVDESNLGK